MSPDRRSDAGQQLLLIGAFAIALGLLAWTCVGADEVVREQQLHDARELERARPCR